MITVVHVITGLDTGGAETMLANLLERSDRTRISHIVVSLTDVGAVGRRIADLGVPVHALHMRRGLPDPRAIGRLVALLRRTRADVMQTWMYHADLFGTVGAVMTNTPVVWNIRSSVDVAELGTVVALIARTLAKLSGIPAVVVSNSVAGQARHTQLGYRPKQWLVIPNGFDLERFAPDAEARRSVREELGVGPNTALIGLVARFDPLKDHATFLRAAGILAQQSPEMHFVLIGQDVTASNDVLWRTVVTQGLQDRVHLLGQRSDIPRLTAAFDIATCSSYGESFPNVVGEAMACAVPCVVTDVGDAAHLVGDTGQVVTPRDASSLADAWQRLLDLAPQQRRELGEAARARVAEQFSLSSVVRQYDALYERLASERKPGQPVAGRALRSVSRLGRRFRHLRGDDRSQRSNVDARTVAGFGNEWSTFDQTPLSADELGTLFEQYFDIFPWSSLPANAVGFDLGCGSGRWARLVAPRVHHLHCIDPSPAALQVAEQNLAAETNCSFHLAAVDSIPLLDNSMDFGYSLGVLHHVPDTAAGIRSCVAKLKPGAPFLLYVYYAFDNRPLWFRLLWRASDALRRVVSALPYGAQNAFSLGMAMVVYWPLARASNLLEQFGLNVDSLPLSYYRHRSFYVMRTDARDRFGTSLEQRFTARQIEAMMQAASLERITFSPHPPYWCAVGVKGDGG